MVCPVCPLKLTREVYELESKACGPCRKQIRQMKAGFHGVDPQPQAVKETWNNTAAFEEWKAHWTESDLAVVHMRKKDDYLQQACDIRDMKRIVGLPKWLPLEEQVYIGWIEETQKDE